MCAAASAVSYTSLRALWETPFPSHSLDDINNRCPGHHAGSRLLRVVASVVPPSLPPHPPPLTLYAVKTGEVRSSNLGHV